MTPIRPIESDWLTTRRAADSQARESALGLVDALVEHIGPTSGLTLVDLGSGTGANPAWLAPRIHRSYAEHGPSTPEQHWLLLDHDPDLLAARDVGEHPRVSTSRAVVAAVDDLAQVLSQASRPVVVTCSALLDLLTAPQIEGMGRAVIESADAALLSLTVTGQVGLSPAHPDDDLILDLFNAHQRRAGDAAELDSRRGTALDSGLDSAHDSRLNSGLAGPAGWRIAAQAFAARGWEVRQRCTPWLLDDSHTPLLRRWLSDRVEAVLELLDPHDPRVRVVATWWELRSAQIDRGELRAEVGHVDGLALPRS